MTVRFVLLLAALTVAGCGEPAPTPDVTKSPRLGDGEREEAGVLILTAVSGTSRELPAVELADARSQVKINKLAIPHTPSSLRSDPCVATLPLDTPLLLSGTLHLPESQFADLTGKLTPQTDSNGRKIPDSDKHKVRILVSFLADDFGVSDSPAWGGLDAMPWTSEVPLSRPLEVALKDVRIGSIKDPDAVYLLRIAAALPQPPPEPATSDDPGVFAEERQPEYEWVLLFQSRVCFQ